MSESEVSAFMHEYCRAFRPGNASAMPRYFHFPASLMASGLRLSINAPDELVQMLSVGLSDLAAAGFSHSEIQDIHVHELADDIALVSARYHRLKADDRLLEEIAASYTLYREADSGWGIVAIVTHDPDRVIAASR